MNDVMMRIDRVTVSETVGNRNGSQDSELSLAMSYIPVQTLKNTYSMPNALRAGTLFPELDKPFLAAQGGDLRG